jgi:lipoprotein-releasing system permease protein
VYRVFLSWRYMRARRTNIIGVLGIMVGVGALILILSIMSGFLDETRRVVRGSLSDLIIAPYTVPRPDGHVAPSDPAALLAAIRADARVAAATPQRSWPGLLTNTETRIDAALTNMRLADAERGRLSFVQMLGIDVASEYATTELRAALESASLTGASRVADIEHPFAAPPDYDPPGRPLASIIVGEQQAAMLNLTRGSIINITTGIPTAGTVDDFRPNNRKYVVAGTFRTGENETDLSTVYLERSELVSLLATPTQYDKVLVKLKNYAKDGEVVRDDLQVELYAKGLIRDRNSGEVRTWEEFRGTLLGAIENEKTLMSIMLSLVVVVAAFTVFAILSMMVTEKRRDIGILSALGATPGGVHVLFLLIGFWDALIGATLGAIIGTWAAIQIDPIERWLSDTFGIQIFNREVYLFDHIPSVVEPVGVALIVLGAFVCTLLFASIPAWKAGRLHPLDALRYE